MKIHIEEAVLEESDEETLLGITLDTKHSLKSHVQSTHYLEFRFSRIQKR